MKLSNLLARAVFAAVLASTGGAQPEAQTAARGYAFSSTPKCRVRFIHAAAGVQAANLRFDRSTLFRRVSYGGAAGFRSLAEGDYWVDVTSPSTETNILPGATESFFAGVDYTVLLAGSLSGDPELETISVEIPTATVPRNEARVLLIHAVPDGPPVDLEVDGVVITTGLPYGEFEPPIPLSSGRHTLAVKAGATTLLPAVQHNLRGGQLHTLVVTGTADPGDGFPLVLRKYSTR